MTSEALALLAAILDGVPSLPDAVCPDWPLIFEACNTTDPETRDYSIATALRICRSCPALASCSAWFESLAPQERPSGVIAGRINTPGRHDMTQPIDPLMDAADPSKMRVPARFGDGVFTDDEYVDADPEAAGQWDARQWHDGLPR